MPTDKSDTLQKCLAVAILLACELMLNPLNTAAQSSIVNAVAISRNGAAKVGALSAIRPRYWNKSIHAEKSSTDRRESAMILGAPTLRNRLKECAKNSLCLRLLAEYGAMFAANTGKVLLPPKSFFRNEAEVQEFQRVAGFLSEVIGGVQVELQPQAMKAFMAARSEARQHKLNISPRGTDSSRRSYSSTVSLWRARVSAALTYWLSRGKITKLEAENLRSLSIERQVPRVLVLETKQIYFGMSFGKSILQSVSAPGASQHNAMLALDVEQYDNAQVRAILAKHGWFQTVRNDAPHFTYLGVKESALPSIGLKRDSSSGITVWVPNIPVRSPKASTESRSIDARTERSVSDKGFEKDERVQRQPGTVTPEVGPQPPRTWTMSASVTIKDRMRPILSNLTKEYFEASGNWLHITSGYRSPEGQARAMYRNLLAYGQDHILKTYGGRAAAREVIDAYRKNRKGQSKAIAAMTAVIQGQVDRGLYISRHLLGKAFDIRLSTARATVLGEVVRRLGGRLGIEADHYHVQF
jgi:hypothetical protein